MGQGSVETLPPISISEDTLEIVNVSSGPTIIGISVHTCPKDRSGMSAQEIREPKDIKAITFDKRQVEWLINALSKAL